MLRCVFHYLATHRDVALCFPLPFDGDEKDREMAAHTLQQAADEVLQQIMRSNTHEDAEEVSACTGRQYEPRPAEDC